MADVYAAGLSPSLLLQALLVLSLIPACWFLQGRAHRPGAVGFWKSYGAVLALVVAAQIGVYSRGRPTNFYELLSLKEELHPPSVDLSQIRKGYIALKAAVQDTPDLGPDELGRLKAQAQQAYDVLANLRTRDIYDRFGPDEEDMIFSDGAFMVLWFVVVLTVSSHQATGSSGQARGVGLWVAYLVLFFGTRYADWISINVMMPGIPTWTVFEKLELLRALFAPLLLTILCVSAYDDFDNKQYMFDCAKAALGERAELHHVVDQVAAELELAIPSDSESAECTPPVLLYLPRAPPRDSAPETFQSLLKSSIDQVRLGRMSLHPHADNYAEHFAATALESTRFASTDTMFREVTDLIQFESAIRRYMSPPSNEAQSTPEANSMDDINKAIQHVEQHGGNLSPLKKAQRLRAKLKEGDTSGAVASSLKKRGKKGRRGAQR